jgi:predicted ATPase with chaperone activity
MVAMSSAVVSAPQSVGEIGIRKNLLEDLALKILYMQGEISLRDLADHMRLSPAITDELFQRLRKEQFCEVKGMVGGVHRITTSSQGKTRALELLSVNQYVGPAPVSLTDYVNQVRAQSVKNVQVRPEDVHRAFEHLVLSEQTLTQLGIAALSGTSIILYGVTGTGKTAMAESLPRIYGDAVWIPYAVEIDNQIITVYDSGVHQKVDEPISDEADGRWILCRRPRVIAGGELTIEMLELQFNPAVGFYAAPLQMKANNGVLIVDDFGRQRMRPEELLNRWIVPLDRRVDYLTLAGGKKFEVPFDLFVVFATNLDPNQLADQAFLRRIQNKIKVDCVPPEQFHQIFQRMCNSLGLNYEPAIVDDLIQVLTGELKQPLRACYPRDLVHHICWAALYEGTLPRLDRDTLAQACRHYFMPPESI